jgi:hypothetical protein
MQWWRRQSGGRLRGELRAICVSEIGWRVGLNGWFG